MASNNNQMGNTRERAALFWVFLSIFSLLAIVSMLIITNVIQSVDSSVKDKATYLLFGSIAVAIITLFYEVFVPKRTSEIELVISVIFSETNERIILDNDNEEINLLFPVETK